MSISKDKIDKLFSQKLESYTVKPRPEAWEKLNNRLESKNKKTRPIWFRLSIAASIALLFGFGFFAYFQNPKVENNTTIYAAQATKPEAPIPNNNIEKPMLANTSSIRENIKANKTVSRGNISKTNYKENLIEDTSESIKLANAIPQKIEPLIQTETAQLNKAELAQIQEKPASIKADENLTIVVSFSNFEQGNPENISETTSFKNKKEKYINKLFKQLKNAKNGDPVEWNQIGFKPAKILARAETRLRLSNEDEKQQKLY
jgi:hypothetical protein